MTKQHWSASIVLATTLLLFFLLCPHVSSFDSPTPKPNDATDRSVLLSFSSTVSDDPSGSFSLWNGSVHFCLWLGVICGGPGHQRVVALDLSSLGLVGLISPAISNLTFLERMDLSNNRLHGPIPHEFGRLSRLQHLNLSINSLQGGVPVALSNCSDLRNISVHGNKLTGSIPHSLANLSSLSYVDLGANMLTGSIPPCLGDILSLRSLGLESNQLSGSIPLSLGKLSRLQKLFLSFNPLHGEVPPSIWNLSSLEHLYLASNNLSGLIPHRACQALPLLEEIFLYENRFHGPLPVSLSNASLLEIIHVGRNEFSGMIPPNLGLLGNLNWLAVDDNHLQAKEPKGWSFLTSLTNCTNLEYLQLDNNDLTGLLPDVAANLSVGLLELGISANRISGRIPQGIGNLVGLTVLYMNSNFLDGSIPASIGMLQDLDQLYLDSNMLSGDIPSAVGNLTRLTILELSVNELTGTIPSSIGDCQNLILLDLGVNRLTGEIPKEILTISTLSYGLRLKSNLLTGSIPSEVERLVNLLAFDVSENKLSGEIPTALSACEELEELDISENYFQGSIPSSFCSLKGIQLIDFSNNNLSGPIPYFLQQFRYLSYLNLSFNNFEGEVPRLGVFENASAVSVFRNKKLCGGSLEMHLPPCISHSLQKQHTSHTLMVMIISIVSASLVLFVLLFSLVARCWMHKSRNTPTESTSVVEKHMKISYADLRSATNGFSSDNLIGTGSFGAVYKGILDDSSMNLVAVKVLKLHIRGAAKSFVAECEVLRNVRHRNLVKIVTACSSVDFRGNDFKAIIFEFMVNGSLDDWLHPEPNDQSEPKNLTLTQRLNVAIDVASAINYLHHQVGEPIIHCDLKPSNILLDADMNAHVGDFGLAQFFNNISTESSQYSTGSTDLKGTIGYVAPEYGMGNRISTYGDIYSYGIILLELITGKRPTDDTFKEGVSLQKFVEMALPDHVMDVVDSRLRSEEDETSDGDNILQSINDNNATECMASLLNIGILCSNALPAERMDVGDILRALQKTKDYFLRK